MNHLLEEYARGWLKENILKCNDGQQGVFKRMYSHKDLEKPINKIIDDMPEDKLSWAMFQVEQTVKKNG